MEQEGDEEASGSGSTSYESSKEKDDSDDKGKVKKLDIIRLFIVFHIIIDVKDVLLVMVQLKD